MISKIKYLDIRKSFSARISLENNLVPPYGSVPTCLHLQKMTAVSEIFVNQIKLFNMCIQFLQTWMLNMNLLVMKVAKIIPGLEKISSFLGTKPKNASFLPILVFPMFLRPWRWVPLAR